MQASWLARLKDALNSILPLRGETWLVLLGLGCYLGTCAALRRNLSWGWAILPGVCLSVFLEGWEIWDHWIAPGVPVRGHVLGILGRHLQDVAIMNIPAAAVAATAWWLERGAEG